MPVQETTSSFNYLDVAANYSGLLIIKILDIQGKLAMTVKETVNDGMQKFYVNVADLKKGSYVMNIFNDLGFVKSIRYTKS